MVNASQVWEKYKTGIQTVATTLAVLVLVGGWTLSRVEAWGDERYVLKGELRATIDALGTTLEERDEAAHKDRIEQTIVDLEDDIVWFSENDMMPSALRRCRKLTRAVREWNDLISTSESKWSSDPIVKNVCDDRG